MEGAGIIAYEFTVLHGVKKLEHPSGRTRGVGRNIGGFSVSSTPYLVSCRLVFCRLYLVFYRLYLVICRLCIILCKLYLAFFRLSECILYSVDFLYSLDCTFYYLDYFVICRLYLVFLVFWYSLDCILYSVDYTLY